MCNLLYSICHVFVHRCSLSSCNFVLRYRLCLFYMNIFMALKRSYLNFLFANFMVLWSMDVHSQNRGEGNMVWSPQLLPIEAPSRAVRSVDAKWQLMRSVSPIWSPKLTQASSPPDHSSHTSFLQSPFKDPRLKLATTAGKRAVPARAGPSRYCPQPACSWVHTPHSHACPGASGGSHHESAGGCAAAPGSVLRTSQRPTVSIHQQSHRGHTARSTSSAPQATTRHCKRQSWPLAPGKMTPTWRPHSQPTLSENTNWKVRVTRKQLTRADVCIWRAASLRFRSSCTWFRSKLENDN